MCGLYAFLKISSVLSRIRRTNWLSFSPLASATPRNRLASGIPTFPVSVVSNFSSFSDIHRPLKIFEIAPARTLPRKKMSSPALAASIKISRACSKWLNYYSPSIHSMNLPARIARPVISIPATTTRLGADENVWTELRMASIIHLASIWLDISARASCCTAPACDSKTKSTMASQTLCVQLRLPERTIESNALLQPAWRAILTDAPLLERIICLTTLGTLRVVVSCLM